MVANYFPFTHFVQLLLHIFSTWVLIHTMCAPAFKFFSLRKCSNDVSKCFIFMHVFTIPRNHFYCVCICICVHMIMHAQLCGEESLAHECLWIWGSWVDIRGHPQLFLATFFETGSLSKHEAHWFSWTVWPASPGVPLVSASLALVF